ncbi:2-isopropylmalate synthase [Rhodobacteraceae bacterium HTCC2150]|nr:2-isopropylmalate synthase [Rhodobacteraceae bacterium HTCC2150]
MGVSLFQVLSCVIIWRDDPPERSRHKARSEATKKEGTTQQTGQRLVFQQGYMRRCVHARTIGKSLAVGKPFFTQAYWL